MNRIVVLCAIFLMASVCRIDAQDVKVVAKELMAGSEVDFPALLQEMITKIFHLRQPERQNYLEKVIIY